MNLKTIYSLKEKAKKDIEYIKLIHKTTLDHNKPNIGLSGKYGLFATEIWWENIKSGNILSSVKKGRIVKLYYSGQDNEDKYNSMDLLLEDGTIWSESIYLNNDDDYELLKIGSYIYIYYVHDERKIKNNGVATYSDTVTEILINI